MKRGPHRHYARPLHEVYTALNAEFWQGRLPPAARDLVIGGPIEARPVVVRRVGARMIVTGRGIAEVGLAPDRKTGQPCLGWFRPAGRYWPARINVLSPLAPGRERQVLLHEMVHLAVFLAGRESESHGPRFRAELRRLAAAGEAWAAVEATLATATSTGAAR